MLSTVINTSNFDENVYKRTSRNLQLYRKILQTKLSNGSFQFSKEKMIAIYNHYLTVSLLYKIQVLGYFNFLLFLFQGSRFKGRQDNFQAWTNFKNITLFGQKHLPEFSNAPKSPQIFLVIHAKAHIQRYIQTMTHFTVMSF